MVASGNPGEGIYTYAIVLRGVGPTTLQPEPFELRTAG